MWRIKRSLAIAVALTKRPTQRDITDLLIAEPGLRLVNSTSLHKLRPYFYGVKATEALHKL